jgi:parvulin-like peptidyl-prolyl isomerase
MKPVVKGLVWAGIVASLAWQARQHDTPVVRWLAPLLHAQNIAAKDAGVSVSQSELDLALQHYLWRRGESLEELSSGQQAQTRRVVIRSLLDQKRLRQARARDSLPSVESDVQSELSQFARMLAFEGGRRDVALNAGLDSEASFEQSVRESLLDERWLNGRLFSAPASLQVREWFQAHRDQLRVPAAYHAAHLFLSRHEPGKPDRAAEMRQIAAQHASGADWSALVSEHSEDERTRHREGDLGWFTAHRMPAGFIAAVQKLRPGQVSAPVETSLGWHLFKLIEARPMRVPELAEMEAEITMMLSHRAKDQALPQLMNSLRAEAAP